MSSHQQRDELFAMAQSGMLNRRDVLRRAFALGLGLPTISVLLAACGGDDDDDSEDTPTESTDGGQEPTEAEEATEPAEETEPAAETEPAGDATEPAPDATEDEPDEGDSGSTGGTLNFDTATTGGGGGQANTALLGYCYVQAGGSMFEVRRLVDSRIIAWTADLSEFVGEIAEEWEMTETAITFRLRQNAMWHDGQPLTSADVLFTYNLIAHPETASRYAGAFNSIVGFDDYQSGAADSLAGLTAPDDYTVVFELAQPDSGILPQMPDIDILPSHILGEGSPAEICENTFWIEESRVGSGPYQWGQLIEAQRIELEAFQDYYLGAPQISKVNLLLFGSYETSLAAFEQQSSLAAPLNADNLEYAEGLDFARIETQSTGVLALFINRFNEELPLFDDVRVRQAMAHAIDRQAIAETLYKGIAAEPTYQPTPWLDWSGSPDLIQYEYDPDRARELLDDAGWTTDAEITLWYYYPDQVSASVVQAIQQYLMEVGINAVPRLNEGGALAEAEANGTWTMTYGAWGINPAVNMGQVWNCTLDPPDQFCNEEYSSLMESARLTFDVDEQREYYQQAVAILNRELPGIWLFNRKNLVVANERLNTGDHGAWAAGSLMYHNFIEEWTIEE